MTHPPIPPDQITQDDKDAAASLIEAYFQGNPMMIQLTHDFRAGHQFGPWPEAFARHRLSALSRQPEAGVMREYVKRAAEILAPYSGDAPGTPAREALVMVNAALFPQARDRVLLPAPQPRDDDAGVRAALKKAVLWRESGQPAELDWLKEARETLASPPSARQPEPWRCPHCGKTDAGCVCRPDLWKREDARQNGPLDAVIYAVLRNWRLSTLAEEDDAYGGYPLVDAVSGDKTSIATGEAELKNLADEIAFAVSRQDGPGRSDEPLFDRIVAALDRLDEAKRGWEAGEGIDGEDAFCMLRLGTVRPLEEAARLLLARARSIPTPDSPELERLRELSERATAGPWLQAYRKGHGLAQIWSEAAPDQRGNSQFEPGNIANAEDGSPGWEVAGQSSCADDAEFIVVLVNWFRSLLAAVPQEADDATIR